MVALAHNVAEAVKAIRSLLGNDEEQHAFRQDEAGWLASRGLSDISGQDVCTAMEYLATEELNPNLAMLYTPYTTMATTNNIGSGATTGGSTFNLSGGIGAVTVPPPPPLTRSGIPQLEHIVDVRNEYVNHITQISDDDTAITHNETTNTITDQSVKQGDIFALGNVEQDFNQRNATAGDGGTAVTGDVTDSVLTSVGGDMTGNQVARDAGDMANVGGDNTGYVSGDTNDASVNLGNMDGGTQISGVRDNAGEVAFGTGEGSVATGQGVAASGTETSAAGRDVLEEGSIGGDLVAPGGDALSAGGDATNTDVASFGSGGTAVGDLAAADGSDQLAVEETNLLAVEETNIAVEAPPADTGFDV